jgi:cytochrome P450
VVSRHADIRELERQPEIFNAGPRMTLLPIPVEQANVAIFGVESGVFPLTAMDGAHHQAMRALTQDFFLPKNIRKLESAIAEHATAFVARMAQDEGRAISPPISPSGIRCASPWRSWASTSRTRRACCA